MDTRIDYLYNKSKENTLCIETADCNNANNLNFKQKVSNLIDWNELEDTFTSNYIHTFLITVKADLKLKQTDGTDHVIRINIFNHSFVLLPLGNDTFTLCDSWEGIHFMNCRKTTNNTKYY